MKTKQRKTFKVNGRYHCATCNIYKNAQEFFPSSICKNFHRCIACIYRYKSTHEQAENTRDARRILAYIKRNFKTDSEASAWTKQDVQTILNNYNHKSLLSGCSAHLVLVPQDYTKLFSRSNMLLLTLQEAHTHNQTQLQHFLQNNSITEPGVAPTLTNHQSATEIKPVHITNCNNPHSIHRLLNHY